MVLDPNDGSVLQVIPLSSPGLAIDLSVCEGTLILHNRCNSAENISIFTIE